MGGYQGKVLAKSNSGAQGLNMLYLQKALALLLVVVHIGLLAWAVIGLLEFHPDWNLTNISNPLFGRAMLMWQWLLVLLASLAYLAGFLTRFSNLPEWMAILYSLMALTCAYQTFFILKHEARFWQMGLEFIEYAVILWILFRLEWFQEWLRRV